MMSRVLTARESLMGGPVMGQFGATSAILLLNAAFSPVISADLPQRSAPVSEVSSAHEWSGFYVGVNIGGGFGDGQLRPRRSPVQQTTTTITVPGSLFCTGNFPTVGLTRDQVAQINGGVISQTVLGLLGYVDNGSGFFARPPGQGSSLTQFYTIGAPVGSGCGVPVVVARGADGQVRLQSGGPGGTLAESAPTTTTTNTTAVVGPLASAQGVDPATFAAVAALPGQRVNTRISGLLGGGQIGYNHQINHLVLGVEADLQGADVNGVTRILGFRQHVSLDSFGTARARLGYAFDRLLIYGTGGFAYGEVGLDYTLGGVSIRQRRLQTGWTAGAGVEYALTSQISIKAEYKHLDLGPEAYFVRYGYDAALRLSVDTVVAGLNYKF